MKKILLFLMALMAVLPASSTSYLTFGVNDTLRVPPSSVGYYQIVMVRAHFDYRLDKWDMNLNFPRGMKVLEYSRQNDMLYIPYVDNQGDSTYCSAQLFCDEYYDEMNLNFRDSLSASIIVPGYWDPDEDGVYETYGTVKWEPGDYDEMCKLVFKYEDYFPDTASIVVREYLSSTIDLRGGTSPNTYVNKRIHLYVGYMVGDVNGDEQINIVDYTTLIDYILDAIVLDEYQLKAADVDGNGIVDIADITALSDLLLLMGLNVHEDPTM